MTDGQIIVLLNNIINPIFYILRKTGYSLAMIQSQRKSSFNLYGFSYKGSYMLPRWTLTERSAPVKLALYLGLDVP